MRLTFSASLILFLFLLTISLGQVSFIPLSIDHATFMASDGKNYIEIYMSFYQNHLNYITSENQYLAEYIASAEILQKDSTIRKAVDRRRSVVDSISQISPTRKFLNVFAFELNEGTYTAKMMIQDYYSKKVGEFLFDFEITPPDHDSLCMSDIELSSHIVADTAKGEFNKNSLLVIPNPANIFHIRMPVIYYYAEVYNFVYSEGTPGKYTIDTKIMDIEGNIVKEYPKKVRKKPGDSAVLVGGHNIVTLPSATYILNLTIEDEETGNTVQQSKRFFYLKPDKRKIAKTDSSNVINKEASDISMYANFSDKEMTREFEMAKYISEKSERKIFSTLNTEGKRSFLTKFWKRFDPNPKTEVNEFKRSYFERLKYANLNFGAAKKEGWQTDRGRILLTYGNPSEIDRNYMSINTKPYEIWHYNELEGGVIFVFSDLRGFGEYELLHSTYSKELYQPDWERLVRKVQSSFDNFGP